MTSSGIPIDSSVGALYNEINLKKSHKYAAFKITDDNTKVVIDETMMGEKAQTSTKEQDKVFFNELKARMELDKPRYMLYDFGFEGKDGRDVKKLAFIYWCSDTCPTLKKMTQSSTKNDIKKCFSGLSLEFQVNDMSDMDYEDFASQILKRS